MHMLNNEELIKKVSVLLRKSLTAFRKVCKVAKRIQVENEWVAKSQASMERLLKVLTQSGHLNAPKKKTKDKAGEKSKPADPPAS